MESLLDTAPEPVLGGSGCITGKPCLLQCSFFCALDLDEDDPDDDLFALDERAPDGGE